MKKKGIIVAIALLLVAGVAAWFIWGRPKPFKVTYETAVVERGSINSSITATGTVEPITQVEVGTQVSGIVDKLYVDYNSEVHKGDVIAELDKTNLLNELASKRSNLNICKTEYDYEEKNYNRTKSLYEKQLVSDSEYETAYYTYNKAKNNYDIAKVELAKAQTNLSYATITSPIDGIVLSRAVEEGQTVASSFSTPTLFIIANDLTRMRVIADVDEADIGGVDVGQRVTFTVDAYPNETFNGEVMQVRQEATTTSNVVTYEVVINAPNPDLKLKPGLTANVTIYTMEKTDILLISGKALHFTPSAKLVGETDTIIDCEGENKVWTREGHVFQAHAIEIGMSTGSQTEVISGIEAGSRVITNIISGQMPDETSTTEETSEETAERSPFMPGPPGSNKKK